MNNNVFVRIDFQNDFVHPHGALSVKNMELIEAHQKFADSLFSDTFDMIIDTYDTHFSETYNDTLESRKFPLHCVFQSWGWQQAAPFKPELNVRKMYKLVNNIWDEVKTYSDLCTDWKGKNVYLAGVVSDVCVRLAMNGFLERGANVIILSDLCQGIQYQISDIIAREPYRPFIESGALKSITTAQFFRKALLDKKVQHDLVNKSMGE